MFAELTGIKVKYANEHNVPYLAFSSGHGAIESMGKMQNGIGIKLSELNSVEIAEDGTTAKIGGGAMSKTIVDTLWEAGKETGELMFTAAMSVCLGGYDQ